MSTQTQAVAPVPAAPAFVMPRPHKGQAVLFYPNGVVTKANSQIAYVAAVSRANIELNSSGMLKETVCHKDDPVVKENIFARKQGVWDFCERDLEIDERIQMLELRIAELESALKKPAK